MENCHCYSRYPPHKKTLNPITEAILSNNIEGLEQLLQDCPSNLNTMTVKFDCTDRVFRYSLMGTFTNKNNFVVIETPLETASRLGSVEMVKLLLQYGVSAKHARRQYGRDPLCALQLAAIYGNSDVIEVLLQHGENVNCAHKYAEEMAGTSKETSKEPTETSKNAEERVERVEGVLGEEKTDRKEGASASVVHTKQDKNETSEETSKGPIESTKETAGRSKGTSKELTTKDGGASKTVNPASPATPLQYAVLMENITAVKVLIHYGAKLQLPESKEQSYIGLTFDSLLQCRNIRHVGMLYNLIAAGYNVENGNHISQNLALYRNVKRGRGVYQLLHHAGCKGIENSDELQGYLDHLEHARVLFADQWLQDFIQGRMPLTDSERKRVEIRNYLIQRARGCSILPAIMALPVSQSVRQYLAFGALHDIDKVWTLKELSRIVIRGQIHSQKPTQLLRECLKLPLPSKLIDFILCFPPDTSD